MGCGFMNILFPYYIIPLAINQLSMKIEHSSFTGISHSSSDTFEMFLIPSHTQFAQLLSSKGSSGADTAMQQCRGMGEVLTAEIAHGTTHCQEELVESPGGEKKSLENRD